MSRSWERKVRKNMSQVNKQRKKQGTDRIIINSDQSKRMVGRNFIAPILLILFIVMYSVIMQSDPNFTASAMYWVTLGCYVLLAALFFFRKPYLAIGKDYVQSRRLTGDKRVQAADIRAIRVQDGYVLIDFNKGGSWMFSRLLNRFQTALMADELKKFAQTHQITFTEK